MLEAEDFKKERTPGTLGSYFTCEYEGYEVCLEKCLDGYCVAIYDKDQSLIGGKTCTRMGGAYGAFEKALEIANEKIKTL